VIPIPVGFRITLDRGTRELAPGVWSGGSPARVVRLTEAGSAVWRQLSAGPIDSAAAGTLARRLTDTGLAHPCPPQVPAGTADVTVVIPVRDRAALLDRCLAALDGPYPVVVVDDGSRAPAAIAAVVAAHGATLIARAVGGGPAAARNTGLDHVTTDLVAFVDSDCVPSPGWIDALAGHFADPVVASVAPRITAVTGPAVMPTASLRSDAAKPTASLASLDRSDATVAERYTRVAGSLDMGREPGRVAPKTALSYVPTAALIARRAALRAVARPTGVFDPTMRIGEDVDLVWRLHAGGWRVRYDPSVEVGHHEPTTWPALLARRLGYGTSAAPLALRHPGNIPPLVVDPWPAMTVAALLSRRPAAAVASFAVSVLATRRLLRAHDLPTRDAWRVTATAAYRTWLGVGRYATRYATPLLLACLLGGGRARWGRRAAAASLLVGPGLVGWARHPRLLDPFRYISAAVADDIAYGAGVWAGCVKHRTIAPLRPNVRWRSRGLPSRRAQKRRRGTP
jgi:GT2 family glycosyltransferase